MEMIKAQREDRGLNSCLAIDGSRGPRGIAQLGTITLAQKTGSLLLPVAASTADCWVWKKSWDRTVVPKPSARIAIGIGEPIEVAPKLDAAATEALRRELERRTLDMRATRRSYGVPRQRTDAGAGSGPRARRRGLKSPHGVDANGHPRP
ncbi:MAG: hypothetical protein U1F11_11190 [Steroidobacteraceae bacterium]